MNSLKKSCLKNFIIMVIALSMIHSISWADSVKVLKDPKPTHTEKKYKNLVVFKTIDAEIDEEHFLAQPLSLAVGNDGLFYVFDRLVRKIFMFDGNGKFLKTFGESGQGPGEFGKRFDNNWLYFGQDGFLYLSSTANKKIIKYSPEGKYLSEEKLPAQEYTFGPFFPITSRTGESMLLNGPKGTIDVFRKLGDQSKPKYSLLSKDDYNWSIILEVRDKDLYHWNFPTLTDTYYDCLPDGRIIVYLTRTSTIKIYKENQLQKKFNVWPQKALEKYREKISIRKQRLKEQDIFIVEMFNNFFMDNDTNKHFYLSSIKLENNRGYGIYRLDVNGTLDKILTSNERVFIRAKKNNIFYGVGEGKILLLKEEASK